MLAADEGAKRGECVLDLGVAKRGEPALTSMGGGFLKCKDGTPVVVRLSPPTDDTAEPAPPPAAVLEGFFRDMGGGSGR